MMHFRRVDRAIAQTDPLGALKIVGDYGGFTYLVSKACSIHAGEAAIFELALELDAQFTKLRYPDAVYVWWGITNPWNEWGGSEPITDDLWIHKRLIARGVLPDHINAILSGSQMPNR